MGNEKELIGGQIHLSSSVLVGERVRVNLDSFTSDTQ